MSLYPLKRQERYDFWFGVAIAFVVAHYFLFCNILRMSRVPELTWASIFSGLTTICATTESLSWPLVFLISAGSSVILTMLEMRKPSYHGIGWKSINPQLPSWWNELQKNRESAESL